MSLKSDRLRVEGRCVCDFVGCVQTVSSSKYSWRPMNHACIGAFNYYKVLCYSKQRIPPIHLSIHPSFFYRPSVAERSCSNNSHALFKSWRWQLICCHSVSPFLSQTHSDTLAHTHRMSDLFLPWELASKSWPHHDSSALNWSGPQWRDVCVGVS